MNGKNLCIEGPQKMQGELAGAGFQEYGAAGACSYIAWKRCICASSLSEDIGLWNICWKCWKSQDVQWEEKDICCS